MDGGNSSSVVDVRAPDEETRLTELKEAVQADWEQREFLQAAKAGVLRMYEFLQTFGEESSNHLYAKCSHEGFSRGPALSTNCSQPYSASLTGPPPCQRTSF